MNGEDARGEGSVRARACFHIALAGIFLPLVGPMLTFILAWNNPQVREKTLQGLWSKRLWLLALADLLVVAALFWLAANRELLERSTEAAKARVAAVDAKVQEAGLFEVLPGPVRPPMDWVGLLSFLPVVAGGVFLAWRARRVSLRPVPLWGGVVLTLGGTYAAAVGLTWAIPAAAGGTSKGATLLVLLADTILFLALALLVRRRLDRTPLPAPPPGPRLSLLKAGLLGAYYLLTGLPRIAVVLGVVNLVALGGRGAGEGVVEQLAQMGLGPLGAAMFAAGVVYFGPLGEELLFRGIILPRLAAQLGERWALWGSAVLFGLLHPHYLLFMPMVVFYGWVFGWARLRTGGLEVPVALHMLVNGVMAFIMLGE